MTITVLIATLTIADSGLILGDSYVYHCLCFKNYLKKDFNFHPYINICFVCNI